jgi:hypothetical protein
MKALSVLMKPVCVLDTGTDRGIDAKVIDAVAVSESHSYLCARYPHSFMWHVGTFRCSNIIIFQLYHLIELTAAPQSSEHA